MIVDWAFGAWCAIGIVIALIIEPDRFLRSLALYLCIVGLGVLVWTGAL